MTLSKSKIEPRSTSQFQISLRTISLVLAVIGLVVSGYLSYLKITDVAPSCSNTGVVNCNVVLNSIYSELFGIPIAFLGFAVYVILGLLLVFETRVAFLQDYGVLLIFAVNLFAWVFSMWLIYVQFVLLQALCPWCLSHETNITVFMVLSTIRLWQFLRE